MSSVLIACLGLGACATLPKHVAKPHSEALRTPESTELGHIVAANNPGRDLSGIRLLQSGDEALASLIALTNHAERTIDMQYYIIEQDASGELLLEAVRAAADRGVRVRILVDDLNTAGEDRHLVHLARHAHIEVRVFNPFPGARSAQWTRFVASANDIPRINHRMHNKLFVADNALAVTGGRNIGDQYFVRDKTSNFIDLDVIAAGAIVSQLSDSFDAFWNSPYAYPIASVASTQPPEKHRHSPSVPAGAGGELGLELDAGRLTLLWVPATVLADRPAKIASEGAPEQQETLSASIAALMRSANHEVIVISAYFVPGESGMALFRELAERGVRIRILTNSLATTDSRLVDIGYSHYRVPLLKLGVELRELRPQLGDKRVRFHPFRHANASLHAKALVIDQKTVFIGSMNMDARSANTNSELGLVIRSGEIAHEVTALLDDISADGSYLLKLRDHSDEVEWVSGEPGAERVWYRDPETSAWRRFTLKLLQPVAPEEML